jgi:hypothetical protein
MDDELQQLADRLRRRREELEQSISEHVAAGTDDLVKRLGEMRERIESRLSIKKDGEAG